MKIAFYINDTGLPNIDMSTPYDGNPGIGGTQYMFLMVTYALANATNWDITMYSNQKQSLYPNNINVTYVEDFYEAIADAQKNNIDFLVVKTLSERHFFDLINKSKVKIVFWSHNYLLSNTTKLVSQTSNIVANVFVGKQQYDRYIDDDIIEKSTYIFNMIKDNVSDFNPDENSKIVCYMGGLIPSKGFLNLAKMWKSISKEIPNAKLYVMGTGKLYSRDSELGPLGIADISYEKQFLPHISENGQLMKSVHFLGLVGNEKYEIFKKCAVGVVNPSARTEIFSVSIMEMAMAKLPVVTLNRNGFPDSIITNKTGILRNTQSDIKKSIVALLKNPQKRILLGDNAKEYIEKFSPENIAKDWNVSIDTVKRVLRAQKSRK